MCDKRIYGCQPMRFEPAAVRAERERERADDGWLFALVGAQSPNEFPQNQILTLG